MLRRFAAVFLGLAIATALVPAAAGQEDKRPTTGFEDSNGEEWTTHEQELEFLGAVDDLSERVEIDVVGKTKEGRPLHLVKLGEPAPHTEGESLKQPTMLFVCSQHGNEPAGREACLRTLRDLAFTDDQALLEQLSTTTILFVPAANPDGLAANTRGNSDGTDINRDHLNLATPEARAIAEVVRDWRPDMVLDLHEYGPSLPLLYDDEILFLWPRNLNVDDKVHDMAENFTHEYVEKDAEENGYTADEYGMYALGDQDIHQSAGDGDEGILRNTMGLRHSLGVLVETAVTEDPRNGPDEVTSEAAVNRRRVDSHMVVSTSALRFFRDKGTEAEATTARAFGLAVLEGRKRSEPVYFGGADNQEPEEGEVQDPPPCGYELSSDQAKQLSTTFGLLGIRTRGGKKKPYVSMAQFAEPLIPLLLDERGQRHSVEGSPDQDC